MVRPVTSRRPILASTAASVRKRCNCAAAPSTPRTTMASIARCRSPASTRRRDRATAATRLEVFGEAGWRIAIAAPMVSAAWVEPFIGVAGVDLHTASFSETPRPGRAHWRVGERRATGLRRLGCAATRHCSAIAPLTLNAMIGWQHVYGGPTPECDACLRQPSLNPVLDRRRADRARCACPRTRRRPAPDLEHQIRPLLFRAPASGASDNAVKAKLGATS